MFSIIISLFLLGLSFGIGPCLASCGPLLISYAAGRQKNITESIGIYFLFSLSRILVYLVLGLSIFSFGQAIVKYISASFSQYLFIFGGLFIIGIGLLMAIGRHLDYGLCPKLQDLFLKKDAKTVIAFGLIAGILPCAPFISVVSYIGLMTKHWLNSLFYILAFGIGTIISPLFLLVVFAGLIPKMIVNKPRLYRIFNLICGLMIMFLGFQLLRKGY